MQQYFPFAHVTGTIDNTVTKHACTVDWQLVNTSTDSVSKPASPSISELYY